MSAAPPNLETRFLEPEGWQWHHTERAGRALRFGCIMPKDAAPNAIIVCLPGLSEFCEKYFETARDCLDAGYGFWVLDWMGQGKSGRYISDAPHKRHATSFTEDIKDLHMILQDHIRPQNKDGVPLVMLAHSMGGNIGLRYIDARPTIFSCAAISAPLLDIAELPQLPLPVNLVLAFALNIFKGREYVFGGSGWREEMRPEDSSEGLSSDPVRAKVHNAWCVSDPELQVGSVTFGWLYNAIKSCLAVRAIKGLERPLVMAIAGQERVVENPAIEKFITRQVSCERAYYPDAYHEILMERDEIRGDFLQRFFSMIGKTSAKAS